VWQCVAHSATLVATGVLKGLTGEYSAKLWNSRFVVRVNIGGCGENVAGRCSTDMFQKLRRGSLCEIADEKARVANTFRSEMQEVQ
jgi:hypothetical protein